MKLSGLAIICAIFVVGVYGGKGELPGNGLPKSEEHPMPDTTTTLKTAKEPETTKTSGTGETSLVNPINSSVNFTTTSTEKSTTSAEKPKPTTEKSTTVGPVTTTVNPLVPSKPEEYTWTLDNGTYKCIIIHLATKLNLTYTTVDNKIAHASYVIPVNKTTITGSCGNGTSDQQIIVEWPTETKNEKNKNNSFSYTFRLVDNQKYQLHEIHYEIFAHDLTNGTSDWLDFYRVNTSFSAPKDKSYHCAREQHLNLTSTENSTQTMGVLTVSHLQLQAYRTDGKGTFSAAIDCDSSDTPGYVPIIVGVSLIVLVVVVLIAYLVGRQRTAARGYVSM